MTYLLIASKLILGFLGLIIVIRLLGKKALSQLTPFDIVYAIVFGGIVEECIYDSKISILQMLFAITVWGICIYLVELTALKFQKPRKLIKGELSLLVEDGKLNHEEMKRNKVEMEQLRTMLRLQGIFSLRDVQYLILEPGGQISVKKYADEDTPSNHDLGIRKRDSTLNYLVVSRGRINFNELKRMNKTEKWILHELAEKGYSNTRNILYAEWSQSDGFYIREYK